MHTPKNRNSPGTLLEPCWNLAGIFAGTSLEPRLNLAGTLLCWSLVKPCCNLSEPCCWNPWLEHLLGNRCMGGHRLSFYIVSCFAWCVGLWCWKSGLNFAGTVLQPSWNLYEDNFCIFFGLSFVSFFFLFCDRQLKTTIPCWDCDAGILAWTFEGTLGALAGLPCRIALQDCLAGMPCRNALQECLAGMRCRNTSQEFPSGSLAGTFRETIAKLADFVWVLLC